MAIRAVESSRFHDDNNLEKWPIKYPDMAKTIRF